MIFSEVYMEQQTIKDLPDLCGKTVAVMRGSSQDQYMQTTLQPKCLAAGSTIELLAFDGESEALLQVKQGRENDYSEVEIKKIAVAVGISAIKYADLSSQRVKDYRFSFEKMLSFKGNTASYMLYSYARISSIVRKLNMDRADIYKYDMSKVVVNRAGEKPAGCAS